MMEFSTSFAVILAFLPLIVAGLGNITGKSYSKFKTNCSTTIVVLAVLLAFLPGMDPAIKFLVFAVLFSGYCVLLCQEESKQTFEAGQSCMVVLGLVLGALLGQGILSRLFLCGLLGYAAFSLAGKKNRSFRTTLILIHLIIAIILSLTSALGGPSLQMISSLFLALTFLPLAPFHLPFVGMVAGARGNLSGFWIVVWLAVGLSELNTLYSTLSSETLFALSWLSVGSAFYSILAALGQKRSHLFVAAATVAHMSIIWGLLDVFPEFSGWGIAFGVSVAFVSGGISFAFSFIQQRYGWQTIGKLPGLASPMPRFGTMMILLVSSMLFLPMIPVFSGLTSMPGVDNSHVEFGRVFLVFLAVWLGGGWLFLQMLHQTAFGEARTDVPYTDLRTGEFTAVTALILGASYSGLLY